MLQSHLARHPDIVTFPESHFFDRMLANRGRLRRWLGLPKPGSRDNLVGFARAIGVEDGLPGKRRVYSAGQLTGEFEALLSKQAGAHGAKLWIEKTPGHSHYIDYIQARIGRSRFIHLIRDGRHVVASLYDVTRKHPQHWSGSWSLEKCIDRWKSAIGDSIRYSADEEKHFVLFYEDLVQEPALWLSRLLRFLELDADEPGMHAMLGGGASDEGHVNDFEDWKTGAERPFEPSSARDRLAAFTDSELAFLEGEIARVDLSPLRASALSRCR